MISIFSKISNSLFQFCFLIYLTDFAHKKDVQ